MVDGMDGWVGGWVELVLWSKNGDPCRAALAAGMQTKYSCFLLTYCFASSSTASYHELCSRTHHFSQLIKLVQVTWIGTCL